MLVLFAHPPIHETDEGPDQETNEQLEPEGVELSRRLESRKLGPGKRLEPLRRFAAGERAALAARDCLEEPLARAEVAEQGPARPGRRGSP
jgi:hypothetical protein